MKFLADQNLERRVVLALRAQGHDVTVGVVDYPGSLPDPDVLALARREGRILLTNDPDFGELIARWRRPHAGVILFRMKAATAQLKIDRLAVVLRDYTEHLGQLIVVTEHRIRVYRTQQHSAESTTEP
jgi:predicted nuclease of predicted toxin-antitoxin system